MITTELMTLGTEEPQVQDICMINVSMWRRDNVVATCTSKLELLGLAMSHFPSATHSPFFLTLDDPSKLHASIPSETYRLCH